MVYEDLELRKRQPLYRRCSWVKRKYGVEWTPRDLFYRLRTMAPTRRGLSHPVLASRDGSWRLVTLYWKQLGTRADKKGYYKSGARFYVRGEPGSSFADERSVRRHLAEPSPFGDIEDVKPIFREQSVVPSVKDWSEDTAFNQDNSYEGF